MKDAHRKNVEFFKGKRVLVTGHTGFKGTWLTAILHYMQADALGYSHAPRAGSLFEKIRGDTLIQSVTGDLLDRELLERTVSAFQPEIVLHLAAFGFMKECFDDPVRAYRTNVLGSANLLEALRNCPSVKSIVLVSTDKVYKNLGDGAVYTESDVLGGQDPYSSSKTCMEFLANDYRCSYFQAGGRETGIATTRASNVLGGGDSIQTRLVPSILRAVAKGEPVELRNPEQTRPWQSVLDALNGYLTVARYLYQDPLRYSGAWNIGPTKDGIRTVSWVFETIQRSFAGLQSNVGKRFDVAESKTLGLDISKALTQLDWEPRLSCGELIGQVAEFFIGQQNGVPEADLCREQISKFFAKE